MAKTVGGWLMENVVNPVGNWIGNAYKDTEKWIDENIIHPQWAQNSATKIFNGIENTVSPILGTAPSNETAEKIMKGEAESGLPLREDGKGLLNILQKGSNWINEKIIQPILDGIGYDKDGALRNKPKIGEPMLATYLNEEQETGQETPTETEINTTEQEGNEDGQEEISKNETLKELMEYLDKLQKHQEEREDTAVQRKVKDMLAAGINPNISGDITGAGSTDNRINAIASAFTGISRQEMQDLITTTINAINNNVKMTENQKDRTTDIIRTLAMILLLKR